MREIKFRGKGVITNNWFEGSLLTTEDGGVIYGKSVGGVKKETIGQYTGLKDKNGKEIYEGDILRGDEYPFNCDGVDNYFAEIVWADNVCGFYRITLKKPNSTIRGISNGNMEQLDENDMKSFEVIGNIHDNPDLIKEEYL